MAQTKKIVLVEDDRILSNVLFEELTEAGFDMVQAFDGLEGLEKAKTVKPDFILLDLLLPKRSGLDVLGDLKKDEVTKDIPVIVLTMLSGDESIDKALKLGADDYIVKSRYSTQEIAEKVQKLCAPR